MSFDVTPMATGGWTDGWGSWQVTLYEKDVEGENRPLNVLDGNKALFVGKKRNWQNTLLPTEFQFTIESHDSFVDKFVEKSSDQFLVELFLNADPIFRGNIISGNIENDMYEDYPDLNIRAHCGLSRLKGIPFRQEDDEVIEFGNLVVKLLNKLGLQSGCRFSEYNQHRNTAGSFIPLTKRIDTRRILHDRENRYCYDMLENVLQRFNCQLFHSNGGFMAMQRPFRVGTRTRYEITGDYSTVVTDSDLDRVITQEQIIGGRGRQGFLQPILKGDITYNFAPDEPYLRNKEFVEWTSGILEHWSLESGGITKQGDGNNTRVRLDKDAVIAQKTEGVIETPADIERFRFRFRYQYGSSFDFGTFDLNYAQVIAKNDRLGTVRYLTDGGTWSGSEYSLEFPISSTSEKYGLVEEQEIEIEAWPLASPERIEMRLAFIGSGQQDMLLWVEFELVDMIVSGDMSTTGRITETVTGKGQNSVSRSFTMGDISLYRPSGILEYLSSESPEQWNPTDVWTDSAPDKNLDELNIEEIAGARSKNMRTISIKIWPDNSDGQADFTGIHNTLILDDIPYIPNYVALLIDNHEIEIQADELIDERADLVTSEKYIQ